MLFVVAAAAVTLRWRLNVAQTNLVALKPGLRIVIVMTTMHSVWATGCSQLTFDNVCVWGGGTLTPTVAAAV